MIIDALINPIYACLFHKYCNKIQRCNIIDKRKCPAVAQNRTQFSNDIIHRIKKEKSKPVKIFNSLLLELKEAILLGVYLHQRSSLLREALYYNRILSMMILINYFHVWELHKCKGFQY